MTTIKREANMNSSELSWQALKVLQIAAIKVSTSGNTSAKLCYRDAQACYMKGHFESARLRALDSLKHSVGIHHKSYINALNA